VAYRRPLKQGGAHVLKEPQAFALICWLLSAGLAVIATFEMKLWPLTIAMAASI
jgi:hypothetical protein